MIKFEKVSRFKNADLPLPTRATGNSAGYDFVVAEDIIVPSYFRTAYRILSKERTDPFCLMNLDELTDWTKDTDIRPTLVPTGMKCYLDKGTFLQLSVRSSCPLKTLLVLGNGVGIIDADYADNASNEGEIFFQLINLSPYDIELKRGDRIGQGVVMNYLTADDDAAAGDRTGGFGSTGK